MGRSFIFESFVFMVLLMKFLSKWGDFMEYIFWGLAALSAGFVIGFMIREKTKHKQNFACEINKATLKKRAAVFFKIGTFEK